MSKRPTKRVKKALEINIDALLNSEDSGNENPRASTSKRPSSSGNRQKKVKPVVESPSEDENDQAKDSKIGEDDDSMLLDVAKSVEDLKKDISKPVKAKKVLLKQFTHEVAEVYNKKTLELRKKQLNEEKELKASFMNEIGKELQKYKEEVDKIKESEDKLVQMFQQHMIFMQKASSSVSSRKKNLLKIAKNYEEQSEQLLGKHESESSVAMESVREEIAEIQTKFLADIQKEEMASLKKLFCSNMFF